MRTLGKWKQEEVVVLLSYLYVGGLRGKRPCVHSCYDFITKNFYFKMAIIEQGTKDMNKNNNTKLDIILISVYSSDLFV